MHVLSVREGIGPQDLYRHVQRRKESPVGAVRYALGFLGYAGVVIAAASTSIANYGGSSVWFFWRGMPIDLKISHPNHLVIVTARGGINAADFDHIFLAQVREHALWYNKLFDLRGIAVDLSASDLMAHAGKLAAYATTDDIGALALVVDPTTNVDASVLASLAAAKRPLRIFQNLRAAENWLLLQ